MRVVNTIRAAHLSDPGLQREHNEDRCHADSQRGIFIVVDGVGGQAAGERAADTALAKLRERLERQTGRIETRIREAIAAANAEIYRLASTRPEWKGMACVLTVAVLDNGDAVVGHVGDTRLYKIHKGRAQKITHDHSPVGEREDAREITELEAMRHPRRNEVFRDVGSEPHTPDDPEFIDILRIRFEPDAALLLCSDGLTDAVASTTIETIVDTFAGHPHDVVRELVEAANDAGGKDNVSVVYVEGEQFAPLRMHPPAPRAREDTRPTVPAAGTAAGERRSDTSRVGDAGRGSRRWTTILLIALIAVVVAGALLFETATGRAWLRLPFSAVPGAPPRAVVVRAGESIAAALLAADAGTDVLVEPGEYRESIQLRPAVRLISRVPRGAVIRLSGSAADSAAAVTAVNIAGAAFAGFRIVGDAATPMGVGMYLDRADVFIADVEISGAKNAGVEFDDGARGVLIGSNLIDNLGPALIVRAGAAPRITHNYFSRNAASETLSPPLVVESDAAHFERNVFEGVRPEAFPRLKDGNWFLERPAPARPQPPPPAKKSHR